MPVVAAAVLPHPPVLVPALAVGAAGELAELREACSAALAAVLAHAPERLVLVGSGQQTADLAGPVSGPAAGRFAEFGVAVVAGTGVQQLPAALTVGAWLLERAGVPDGWEAVVVAEDAEPAACGRLGVSLAARSERLGLIVMGDGSARRSEQAPGHFDVRAAPFDAAVAAAIAGADAAALAALDPVLAGELLAAGRASWQVLAGAAGGQGWRGRLLADVAPYGVGYFVGVWELVGASEFVGASELVGTSEPT